MDFGSILDSAFDPVGLRDEVTVLGGTAPLPTFRARFDQPQRVLLEDRVHVTDYMIEYTTAEAPRLRVGSRLLIKGETYSVTQPPAAQGDGHWTIADLEKV